MREKRVIAPDGHAWHVRRRWAKRQLPRKRRAGHELFGPLIGLFSVDAEVGIVVVLALLALAALGVFALAGLVRDWVVPFLVANISWIGATLAAIAILVVLDRLTRPWFIEAESARLFHAPRRIWRIQRWWRSRRAFHAVATAIAEGRIDNERGVILFTERSTAR